MNAQYFLDSSALVKRYVEETGTTRMVELITSDELLVVARLAQVEIVATAVRRAKANEIEPDDLIAMLQVVDHEFRSRFEIIELGGATIARSIDVAQVHALKAADSIQLASALLATSSDQRQPIFVSADVELNEAARSEGFQIETPGQQ